MPTSVFASNRTRRGIANLATFRFGISGVTNWATKIGVREGVHDLVVWVRDNVELYAETQPAGHVCVGVAEAVRGG